ncbi:hypothetical protein SAMN04488116_3507 [Flagellimonas flava]|uniref:Uncharacterized protein n=1 Tax=Flagellimonas flava TaxID=570519 RepID=A0A1M5Q4W2_9FLAO|nr:hypothetical protein SAMN04488116_3507 [Allomuricauda flava]
MRSSFLYKQVYQWIYETSGITALTNCAGLTQIFIRIGISLFKDVFKWNSTPLSDDTKNVVKRKNPSYTGVLRW